MTEAINVAEQIFTIKLKQLKMCVACVTNPTRICIAQQITNINIQRQTRKKGR